MVKDQLVLGISNAAMQLRNETQIVEHIHEGVLEYCSPFGADIRADVPDLVSFRLVVSLLELSNWRFSQRFFLSRDLAEIYKLEGFKTNLIVVMPGEAVDEVFHGGV